MCIVASHYRAWIEAVNAKLCNSDWARLIGRATRALSDSELGCCHDIVTQQSNKQVVDVYDAVAVALFHAAVESGNYARCAIDIGETPASDGSAQNVRLLASEMPAPFRSEAVTDRGRGAHADGYVEWSEPVEFEVLGSGASAYVTLPPRRIPLEIGDTAASRTMLHMAEDGALARWPYGSGLIHLFVRL